MKYEEELHAASDAVWQNPEPGFEEYESTRIHQELLKKHGFRIEENVADTITGYKAVYGHGHPVIALLGEFDALYGLGQKADCAEYSPDGKAMGHGCGHHLLGVGNIGAGLLIKDYLEQTGKSGTVVVLGCPAEEAGSGKTYMARDGVFDDVDIALAWHPGLINQVATGSSQSCISAAFHFHGKAAHAAGNPQDGRSALDAVELMDVGVNYLREHMDPDCRVHYAITDAGGKAPNVVQAEAEVKYFVRSSTNRKCSALYQRVIDVAKGAALMTGTQMTIKFDEALSNTMPNFVLEDVIDKAFRETEAPVYTAEDLAYAQKFKDTADFRPSLAGIPVYVKDRQKLLDCEKEKPLCGYYVENAHSDVCEMGSTDVGDVSYVVPTATLNTACYSWGAGAHSWQWVAQGESAIAHKGMDYAARVLAKAAVELIEHPETVKKAKEEWQKRTKDDPYECLIPKEIKPHQIIL
ncbi:MAG: amidohydrolase [Bulleidia sp.]|nr:amidohydrolase [Bulleidia sp.]